MPVRPRRSTSLPWWVFAALVLALIVLSVGVVALAGGESITIPWIDQTISLRFGEEATTFAAPEGRLAVPMAARPIAAYRKVGREDVWDGARRQVAVTWMTPEAIERSGVLTELSDIVGRVMGRDKGAGFVFTERDFLPQGTRPGLVAGIPPGKRAMRVDVSKVPGLVGLHPGDRFDLVTSIPVEGEVLPTSVFGGPYGDQMALQAGLTNLYKQATVRVVVQNGVVVTTVETRQLPVSSNTLTQGLVTQARTLQEIVVAVAPEEVAPLAEALAVEASMVCVPRSGHPEDPTESVTPSSDPRWPFWGAGGSVRDAAPGGGSVPGAMSLIETIDGEERGLLPVPRSRP